MRVLEAPQIKKFWELAPGQLVACMSVQAGLGCGALWAGAGQAPPAAGANCWHHIAQR